MYKKNKQVRYDIFISYRREGGDYPFGDAVLYLGENDLPFLYADNVALYDDLSRNSVKEENMYVVKRSLTAEDTQYPILESMQ